MPSEPDLAAMEAERARLYADLGGVGDFRRGALSAVFRRCGKAGCHCAQPGDRGHGPQYNLTRWLGGKTVTTHPRPGPELDKAEREAATAAVTSAIVGELAGEFPGRDSEIKAAVRSWFPRPAQRGIRRATLHSSACGRRPRKPACLLSFTWAEAVSSSTRAIS